MEVQIRLIKLVVWHLRQIAATLVSALLIALLIDWIYSASHMKREKVLPFISPKCLDLGTVWSQRDIRCELPLFNNSKTDIEIDGITPSCHCSQIQPTKLVIPAFGQRSLFLQLDATAHTAAQSRVLSHQLVVDLFARITRPQLDFCHWKIRCEVRNPIILDSNIVNFGEETNVLLPNHSFRAKSIGYESAISLKGIEAKVDKDDIVVRVQPVSDKAGRIEIQPNSEIPAGIFRRQIELKPIPQSSDALPSIGFEVIGFSIQDIYAIPSGLAFGPSPIGNRLSTQITLESRSKQQFSVVTVSTSDKSLSVTPIDAANSLRSFEVGLVVDREGLQTGHAIFHVKCGENNVDVDLPCTYVGI